MHKYFTATIKLHWIFPNIVIIAKLMHEMRPLDSLLTIFKLHNPFYDNVLKYCLLKNNKAFYVEKIPK